jgi:allene oxide cyclase-like protein
MGARRAGIALAGASLLLGACGSNGGTAGKDSGAQTIRLHARPVTVTTVPERGSVNAWGIGSILTDAHRARVGVGHAFCVASPRRMKPTDKPNALAEGRGSLRICVESFELQGGQITAQGEVLLGGVRTMPVVGGTGKYAGAIGTLRTAATRKGEEEIVIRVAKR